jgi:hypothetical protein
MYRTFTRYENLRIVCVCRVVLEWQMMVVPCSGGKTGRLKKQIANSEFFLWELVQQFVFSVSVLAVTHPFV